MIAELGQIALALALVTAIYQGVAPVLGDVVSDRALMVQARRAAVAQGFLVVLAFVVLTYLHATSDFSVRNVFENSHTAKPFAYKISGVWGNHEGSMLLWTLILAGYGAALALTSRTGERLYLRALSVQGWVAAAFLAFLMFTSNPFARISPTPPNGQGLNPLLQDPGLAIHPPFLYLGYVGFSIVFAFAIAGLVGGRIDRAWARAIRPWALASWVFLTIGIALGSWWAYYELGWGGFWAWDPVENASFLPWLAGTALIHSVRVLEVRSAFKAWTVLLAIMTFSLSLVGTFLVRSGILTSVHAFAVDPERGVFILAILAVFIGGALALFAWRGHAYTTTAYFEGVSRETALLINNLILSVMCAIVFIGTFYPLFVDVMSGERISVGAPYFNFLFPFFALPMLFLMAPGTMIAWKSGDPKAILRRLVPVAITALAVAVLGAFLIAPATVVSISGAAFAIWVGGGVVVDVVHRSRPRNAERSSRWARLTALPQSYLGMSVAHIGVAVATLGVIGAGAWRSEVIAYADIGDVLRVGSYEVTLSSVSQAQGPNFASETAEFSVARGGRPVRTLTAERRFYPVRGMQTTEAGVWSAAAGDLYFTIGEQRAGQGWPVHGYFNPLASFMWIGGALIAVGGIVAGIPARKRRPLVKPSPASAAVAAE